jgi:ribonuclease P protein component
MSKKDIFSIIRLKGARASSGAFSVYYKDVGEKVNPRVVVSLKVEKRAVVRNRIRRQIKEILKDISPTLGIMVITKQLVLKKSFQEMKEELIGLIK